MILSLPQTNAIQRYILVKTSHWDPRQAKRLRKNWELHRELAVNLLRSDDGSFYWIIDGQHRIYLISEVLCQAYDIHATVYMSKDDMPPSSRPGVSPVLQAVTTINIEGKRFSSKDNLVCTRGSSPWETEAKKRGLDHLFLFCSDKEVRGKFQWNAVITALLQAQTFKSASSVGKSGQHNTAIMNKWLNPSAREIQDTLDVIEWWEPAAIRAMKEVSALYRLDNHDVSFETYFKSPWVAAAFLIYQENKDQKWFSDRLTSSLTLYGKSAQAQKSLTRNENTRMIASFLLKAFNQNRRHKVTLFGKTEI